MNGDIAHRSIRSSMSRMVDARLPRMISSVTGSTARGRAGAGASGMGALQDDVVEAIDARTEARRHEAGGVLLVHDGRSVEHHRRRQPGTRVDGDVGKSRAAEIYAPPPNLRG